MPLKASHRRLSFEQIVSGLYKGMLAREPDSAGFSDKLGLLGADGLEGVVASFLTSPEFRTRFLNSAVPMPTLPDLTIAMPDHYEIEQRDGDPMPVYVAPTDADMTLMSSLIEKHRYYDRLGVWTPSIDLDKEITAAIVRGLGARSCFEVGCFTGPVLSLLADAGVSVLGADVSHLAFVFAYPNIRDALIFGDLLKLESDRVFDVVLCMDVLEHICPLQLDAHLQKLVSLLGRDGYIYLNSPMWGEDRIFGVFERPYLSEWQTVGDASYWRHWPCDSAGWPLHGHLIWASPVWWEETFRRHGLVRDEIVEAAIHETLGPFFDGAPGRRSLFVLRRPGAGRRSSAVAEGVQSQIAQLVGLSRDLNSGGKKNGVRRTGDSVTRAGDTVAR